MFTIEFYIVLQLDIDGLPVPPIGDGQTHNILKITYSTQGDTKVELIQWLHLQGLIGKCLPYLDYIFIWKRQDVKNSGDSAEGALVSLTTTRLELERTSIRKLNLTFT